MGKYTDLSLMEKCNIHKQKGGERGGGDLFAVHDINNDNHAFRRGDALLGDQSRLNQIYQSEISLCYAGW